MAEFLEYKQRVVDFLGICIDFARKNRFDDTIAPLIETRDKLTNQELFILTCGEMRRGKSSMLAAFLEDEDLFPVDVAVTTCVITMVRYAQTEKITVVLEDGSSGGKQIAIQRGEIRDYVMEQNNENNHKKVRTLLIETPNAKLQDGFVFVDTPGVGSLNPEHSLVTYGVLPLADIVLFVSDATSPLTGTEVSFLKQMRKYCKNFLFVLTKKDLNQEYPNIIEENKEKIAREVGILKEGIHYIPVSSTMKLSSMKKPNPRFLRSSNFDEFERIIWDTIYRNRANLIITPHLARLALELQKMEKSINIQLTGVSGSSVELRDLETKLKNLAQQRQELLSNSATWQLDINGQVRTASFDFNRMVTDYQQAAMATLDEGLRDEICLNNPEQLLNRLICLTVDTSREMSDSLYRKLRQINDDFECKNGITLYNKIIQPPMNVQEAPNIIFEKKNTIDKLIDGGRQVSMSTLGGTTAGSVIGGVIGGILGLFGGPGGVIVGVQVGAALGGAAGMGTGAVRGVSHAIHQSRNDAPKIRQALLPYINQTITDWKTDFTPYLDRVSTQFIATLRQTVENSRREIEADIKALQDSAAMGREHQQSEQTRMLDLRNEFNRIVSMLAQLKKEKVSDQGFILQQTAAQGDSQNAEKIIQSTEVLSEKEKTEKTDYSFLED